MKTLYPKVAWVLSLCAALTLVSSAHADEPKSKSKQRQQDKASSESAVTRANPRKTVKGAKGIPTRDGRNSQEVEGRLAGGANGPEYRVPTGSQIPRRYNRRGYTTDDDRNTFIIDQNDQRLQSHTTTSEVLRTVPGVSVSGPRGL